VNVYLFPSLQGSYVPEIPTQVRFAQVIIEYTCELYKCVQGSPVEIQAPSNGNLICHNMTALVSVITQQYSSIIFVLCPDSCKEKAFACLKNVILLHAPENVLILNVHGV